MALSSSVTRAMTGAMGSIVRGLGCARMQRKVGMRQTVQLTLQRLTRSKGHELVANFLL